MLDDFPWLQETIDEQLESVSGVSHTDDIESQRADIRELIETWGQQISGDVGAVYCSVATRFRLHFYLYHCELRAENEEDEFELPESIEKIQTLYEHVESAENGDEPIAIIHKDHLPFEEPEDVEDQ